MKDVLCIIDSIMMQNNEQLSNPHWQGLLRGAHLLLLIIFSLSLAACNSDSYAQAEISETPFVSPSLTGMNLPGTSILPNGQKVSATTMILEPSAAATITPRPSVTPNPTSTPTALLCWGQGGHFEVNDLNSELLPDPLSYRVYLPPCYDEQPERRYPVLYLIHGQSSNDDQWERLGAGSVVDELAPKGELPAMLIVMPRDRVWKEPTEDNFGRVVAEELVPLVDKNYRTQPDRAYRAVGGLSRGGAWALHLGLEYWELFGSIGAHSGFIFLMDTYLVKGWLDEIPLEEMPRIFMDVADRDRPSIVHSAAWFEDLLTQRSIAHEWRVYPGYHEEGYWQAHVWDYLRWYAMEWGTEEP